MHITNIISTLHLFPIANHNFPAPTSRRMHPNSCELSLLSHWDQITRFLSQLPLLQLFTKNLFTGFLFINFTQLQQTLQPVLQDTEFPITECISKHPNAFLLLLFYISVRDFICKTSYALYFSSNPRTPQMTLSPKTSITFHINFSSFLQKSQIG